MKNPIFDLTSIPPRSLQEIDALCDLLESLPIPDLAIIQRIDDFNFYACGHTSTKAFRLEPGAGILVSSLVKADSFEEEGYLYEDPVVGLTWLLCKLGYGTNASNFEEDTIVFQPETRPITIRLAFERPLDDQQRFYYESLTSTPVYTGDSSEVSFGASLLDKIKIIN